MNIDEARAILANRTDDTPANDISTAEDVVARFTADEAEKQRQADVAAELEKQRQADVERERLETEAALQRRQDEEESRQRYDTAMKPRPSLLDDLHEKAKVSTGAEHAIYHELIMALGEVKMKVAAVAKRVEQDAEHIAHNINDFFRQL